MVLRIGITFQTLDHRDTDHDDGSRRVVAVHLHYADGVNRIRLAVERIWFMELLQVAQHAEDLDRAAAFYELLLGTPPTGHFDPPGLLFFQVGQTRLLLEHNAASALLYLRVDDLDATIDRLRAAHVTIESEPHVIFTHEDDQLGPAGTTEWQAFIRDSEGNLVGLVGMEPTVAETTIE